MADRYWRGGTGTWSSTDTANWSTTSGGAGGASVPTAADDVFFDANSNVGTSAFTVTMANVARVCRNITISGLDGAMTLAGSSIGLTVSGSLFFPATNFSRTYSGTTFFNSTTTGNTITTNGISLANITISGVGGEWTLGSAITASAGSTTFLSNGTLNLGGFTLSTPIFSSNASTVRTINFGTGNIALTSLISGTTVLNMSSTTNLTISGTGGFTRNQVVTATVSVGTTGGSVARAPNLSVTAGIQDLTIAAGSWFNNLNFTGSNCIVVCFGVNIAGVLTLSSSGTYENFFPTFRVTATLNTLGRPILGFGVNGTGITVSLAGTVTCGTTGSLVLTEGTLNLNGFNVSVGAFSSSGTTTRSLSFGSNNITLTGGAGTTIISCAAANNFTWTGTGRFIRNQTSTATVVFGTTGGSASNAINLTVNGGASTLTITGTSPNLSKFNELIFTGSTCSVSGSPNVYGNVTLASGGTYTSFAPVFAGTSIVTSSGKAMGGIGINSSGASLTLADAMSVSSFLLTNGTLFLAGFSLSSTGIFAIGAGTKNITFDGGTIFISATTSAWNNVNPTGFTTTAGTGTGIISMTAATAKTFVGGGSTYNCKLNQGGAGTLDITGSNTFNDIGNTTQPASVTFTAGSTNTFSNFSLSGTSGNLITIGSQTAASHTLSKSSGTVSVSFCSISRSNATGGAAWQSYTPNGNVDGGNNTGWEFFFPVIYNVSISESSQILDSIVAELIRLGVIDEFANALDSVISNVTLLKTIDEEAISIDSIEETLVLQKGIDEFSNAQDSQSSNSILVVSQSEIAQADDETISVQIYPKSLSEQTSIDSSNSSQVVLGISFIDETANIASDNSFVYVSFPVNISETALALDSLSRNLVISNNIFEEAVAEDSQDYVLNIAKSLTEISLADDAVATGAFTRARSVANIAISSSAVSETKTSLRSLGESSSATDLIGRNYVIQFQVDDAAAAIAAFQSSLQTQPVQISESLSVSDLNSWAYYWSIVVDTQTANWQNVVDTQSPTWVTVQDTQTANWQNVTDTQSPSWSDVGTNQTPNWQQIN